MAEEIDESLESQDYEEIEFSREEARKMAKSYGNIISEERWQRVKELIDFRDLVIDRTGRVPRGRAISCPFHGRDSNPSFFFYQEANDAFCFGCPDKDQYWDHVKFISRYENMTRVGALKWLEKEYNLPPMEEDIEEIKDTIEILIQINDLKEPYIRKVNELVKGSSNQKVPIVLELMRTYFQAEKDNDPLPLATILGAKEIKKILKEKQLKMEIDG